ncbi:sensor histidine kinase [Tropicimonas marinistellae]|uniref:sensor histidine kinase n=1 Tax=Tropicimonas marinistellae TaxID=1739787 RepID=UPI000ADC7D40|nr:cache domain-containing protein [Tropicimonas marinistellae]
MVIIAILTATVGGWGIYRLSYEYFVTDELNEAGGRLSLYRGSIAAELEQYAPLIHVLARDTFVIDAATGGNMDRLDPRLKDFSDQAGLDAIYLIRPDGVTVASANYDQPGSFVGEDYSFRPYFQQAMAGKRGRFYAIGTTTGRPGYFLAEPVVSGGGGLVGVISLKISFAELENNWRNTGEQLFLANEDGVIILASNSSWLYRVLSPLTPSQRAEIDRTKQFADKPLDVLDWSPRPGRKARIGGVERLHLVSDDLPHGWALHYFATDDRAVARSWLVTASAAVAAGLMLYIVQIQRARRIGAALQRSEQEEAQLRQANERLAVEIAERRQAETDLRRTQNELERASRLAALGELSASVTHELGQPISAMRNHLVAAELGAGKPDRLLGRLGGLVDRMEGITRQLKFFATPDPEPFETFDLREAMQASLGLLRHNIEDGGVAVEMELPTEAVLVRGSRLRTEQVMTNLIRNALNAVEDVPSPKVEILMGTTESAAWFDVCDNGHGLGQATLDELQEPFVTTRASGHGMGLGLAISANIIKDHEGEMKARNTENGGAVFHVSFPRPTGTNRAVR